MTVAATGTNNAHAITAAVANSDATSISAPIVMLFLPLLLPLGYIYYCDYFSHPFMGLLQF